MDAKKLIAFSKEAIKRLVDQFAEVETDKGTLVYDGELAVGTRVQVYEGEELVDAPDGEYAIDGKTIVVAGGLVVEIKETVELDETPVEDEKDLRIAELEGLLKDRDAIIEELNAKIKELEDKPAEEAVELSAVVKDNDKFSQIRNIFN